jgi:hypothetical protein
MIDAGFAIYPHPRNRRWRHEFETTMNLNLNLNSDLDSNLDSDLND